MKLPELKKILLKSWDDYSSSEPENWVQDNPSIGQCAVTAAVVQDYLGGDIVWAPVEVDGRKVSHYFNLVDGEEIDLTRKQFPDGTTVPKGIPKTKQFDTTRQYVLSYPATVRRYELLKAYIEDETEEKWGDYLLRCWQIASKPQCKKRSFGAVVVIDDEVVGEGRNRPAHPQLIDLCEPECIRESIRSGTKQDLCAAVHAETVAVERAHKDGYIDLTDTTLYVAGFNKDGSRLLKSFPSFYCMRCASHLAHIGVPRIGVPTKDGQAILSIDDAVVSAKNHALGKIQADR